MFDKYQSSWSLFDRADGGCRHIAAALFDLEASVRFNDLQSCTSRQCMWKKKGKRNEGSLPIQELQTNSGGYGVTVRDSAKPRDFNPLCIPYDPAELEQQFKAGLLETFPGSSALPFLHSAEEPGQTEEEIRALISDDLNVSKQESVQSVDVYTMSDYAKVFVSVNIEKVTPTVSIELATEFLESISFNEEQAEMIKKRLSINPSPNFGLIKGQEELQLSHFTPCATSERAQTRETL